MNCIIAIAHVYGSAESICCVDLVTIAVPKCYL
jgi:hypothetical protein